MVGSDVVGSDVVGSDVVGSDVAIQDLQGAWVAESLSLLAMTIFVFHVNLRVGCPAIDKPDDQSIKFVDPTYKTHRPAPKPAPRHQAHRRAPRGAQACCAAR